MEVSVTGNLVFQGFLPLVPCYSGLIFYLFAKQFPFLYSLYRGLITWVMVYHWLTVGNCGHFSRIVHYSPKHMLNYR